jgi:hypothetical protein
MKGPAVRLGVAGSNLAVPTGWRSGLASSAGVDLFFGALRAVSNATTFSQPYQPRYASLPYH